MPGLRVGSPIRGDSENLPRPLVDLDLQLGPEEVAAPVRLEVEGGTWAARRAA
jgi:hypothetical protein